jgi:WhiB family redox-sensing transcriptional regulator
MTPQDFATLDLLSAPPGEFRDWRDLAACVGTDPEAFFPDDGCDNTYARKVCGRCDVRTECLEWAIENRVWHGIWGGVGARSRQKMAQRRKATVAA